MIEIKTSTESRCHLCQSKRNVFDMRGCDLRSINLTLCGKCISEIYYKSLSNPDQCNWN